MIEQLKIYDVDSPKVRLGRFGDGGYVIPNIILDESCAIFGYGVGSDISFELDFVNRTQKPAFLYDHTCGEPHIPEENRNLATFFSEGLSYQTHNHCDTFFSHYEKSGLDKLVFLKMDIEGAEFDFFLNTDIETLSKKVAGLVIEFHPFDNKDKWENFFQIIKLLNKYFYLVHLHGNNWAGKLTYDCDNVQYILPHVLELTFVNKSILSSNNKIKIDYKNYPDPLLDTPNRLDVLDHDLEFLKLIREIPCDNDPIINNISLIKFENNISYKDDMIFISLTTVPKRINLWESFKQNLQSLLSQNTQREFRILLNIPYKYNNTGEDYIISDELSEFIKNNPKILLNRIDRDIGPVTKITGALQYIKNPKNILIVCDDDHVYHEDMIEYHLKKMKQYPNSIICFRGDNPIEKREWIENGVVKYTLDPTHFYFPVKHDSRLIIPGHWHSVGYIRGFFQDDFLDENFLNLSVNDDILSGYYFRLKKIPIICAKWDAEDDWRPVNHNGRQSGSFPIKFSLPYPNSGFNEFRQKVNDQNGKTNDIIFKEFQSHDRIYEEFVHKYSKVIVSLTTIPSRLSKEHESGLKSNIYSLLHQDFNDDYEIHFNIPSIMKYTGERYIIPEWLRKLSNENKKLKIFDNLEDFGPITKLIPTLIRVTDGDTIIIVCDDDLVYHEKMIEEHVKNQMTLHKTAIGYDGSRAIDQNCFDDIRNHYVVSVFKDTYVKILQHYKTVSYRRNFFEKDFFDDFVGKSWNDDILVSAYLGKHGINKLVKCYENEEKLLTLEQWQEKGGVTTFPVIKHTSHEGIEGCALYRRDKIDDAHMQFINLGYI